MLSPQEQYWIWLSSIVKLGQKQFYQLISIFGDAVSVWKNADAKSCAFLSNEQLRALQKAKTQEYFENLFYKIEKTKCQVCTRLSKMYPKELIDIYDPPPVLYYKGKLPTDLDKTFAVVGARSCTRYGAEVTRNIVTELTRHGVMIVSGLAYGIDTIANSACVEAGGFTIAVLGCGVDICYPTANRKLYDKIVEKGCVISEYVPGTPTMSYNFPARNRIISGLSKGVLLVEGRQKSGGMITVDFAIEHGREVFAVPGPINAATSYSPNILLRDGAHVVLDAYDILEVLRWGERPQRKTTPNIVVMPELDEQEKCIVNELLKGDCSIDELVSITNISVVSLNSLLTMLELRGIIKQLPGKIFEIATTR